MRKAFNKNSSTVLDILPIDEITPPLIPVGIEAVEKINYKHNEVFDHSKTKNNIKLDIVKDEVELVDEDEDETVVEESRAPKKGRGKRGKDKKPRAKRPPTEKQLAHLARIRELSKQKREAKKLEKERIKKEIAQKAEYNTSKNRVVNIPKTKPVPIKAPVKPKENDYMQFFNLMDRYEDYKVERNKVKQLQTKAQPHPSNRVITQRDRPKKPVNNVLRNTPKPPTNPYDIYFNY